MPSYSVAIADIFVLKMKLLSGRREGERVSAIPSSSRRILSQCAIGKGLVSSKSTTSSYKGYTKIHNALVSLYVSAPPKQLTYDLFVVSFLINLYVCM